ncbi:MAG: flagellar biosynthesis regulator FlaF [Pseudomonadota bacterium]
MNANAFAAAGYQKSAQSVGAPQTIELQAFQRVNAALRAAQKEAAGPADLAKAVHMNNRLWSVLAVDLADDGNQLPEPLRVQLLGLAVFSVRHGEQVLEGKEDVQSLINVNGSVMGGLVDALKVRAA